MTAEPGRKHRADELSICTRCGMEVRSSELWAHTAHAHNIDLAEKKQKAKSKNRDRGRS